MKIINKIKNRFPGGWVYNQCKNTNEMLRLIKSSGRITRNREVYEYLQFCSSAQFLMGKKKNKLEYKKLLSIFGVGGGIIQLGGIVVPIPEVQDINSWNYELVDLIAPYLFYDEGDYNYSELESGFFEGPYELNENVCVNNGDVVIDCGANTGFFSAVASCRGAETIYAFEPLDIVIEKYLSITANNNKNITIINSAVSDKEGETTFIIDPQNIGGSRIGNDINGMRSIVVRLTTLDNFVNMKKIKKINFIKCDIEGAERDMLKGATWVLQNMQPKLSICTYHYPEDPELLEEIIMKANPNYIVEHRYKKLYAYVPHA